MAIPKQMIGLAGEFAVASELCRRGIYAQLTYGNRKSVDILTDCDNGMARVQVKAKQGNEWPGVRGVCGNDILVLVDFQKKRDVERPDFYILTATDWAELVKVNINEKDIASGKVSISETNVPTWNNQGPYVGMSVWASTVAKYRDAWDKFEIKQLQATVLA